MEKPWEETDRDRGILTQSDRQYLVGEKEVEGQQERNTRFRIRQRTIQGLLDVVFLNWHLSGDDRRQIGKSDLLDRSDVRRNIHGMAYDLLISSDPKRSDKSLIDALETELETMLDHKHPFVAQSTPGEILDRSVSVEVEIEDEIYTPSDIENRLYSGDANHVEAMTYKEVIQQEKYEFEGEEEALQLAEKIIEDYISNQ